MDKTRELKDKWTEVIVAIQHKSGGVEYSAEHICISSMLATAIIENKPLDDNEIETIEAIMRVKMFKHDLL